MIDLEQAIREEFAREAAEAPDAQATQRYALSFVAAAPARRMRQWLLPAVAAVLLAIPIATMIAIRAGSHHAVTAASDPSELYGTSWTLSRYVVLDPATGKIVSDSVASTATAPTLQFTGQDVYRYGGCTTVSGPVSISAGVVNFGPGNGAGGLCGYVDPRVSAENSAMAMVLARSVKWQIENDVLTLTATDGRQLAFAAAYASSNPRDLYDEDWGLTRWVKADGSSVSYVSEVPHGQNNSDPLTLWFNGQGGFSLSDCDGDTANGNAEVTAGHLTMTSGVSNRLKCQTQNSAVNYNLPTNVLQTPNLSWQVRNSVLTISAPDGQQLIFHPLLIDQATPSPGR